MLIRVSRLLRRYKIVGQYDLIVRNPYETEDDMVEVCKTLAMIPKPYRLQIFALAMFPNTPLRMKAIEDGIKINKMDGYETRFGSYPIKYPYLYKLQEICPFTPRILINFFLLYRGSRFIRSIFSFYYYFVYKYMDKARRKIMSNTKLVDWTRKIIFLPNTIIAYFNHLCRTRCST